MGVRRWTLPSPHGRLDPGSPRGAVFAGRLPPLRRGSGGDPHRPGAVAVRVRGGRHRGGRRAGARVRDPDPGRRGRRGGGVRGDGRPRGAGERARVATHAAVTQRTSWRGDPATPEVLFHISELGSTMWNNTSCGGVGGSSRAKGRS